MAGEILKSDMKFAVYLLLDYPPKAYMSNVWSAAFDTMGWGQNIYKTGEEAGHQDEIVKEKLGPWPWLWPVFIFAF